MRPEDLKMVAKDLSARFLASANKRLAGLVGVGVGATEVHVYLEYESEEVRRTITEAAPDTPIKFTVTGPIYPL